MIYKWALKPEVNFPKENQGDTQQKKMQKPYLIMKPINLSLGNFVPIVII